MADISDINAAQTIKIVGADSSGVEQTPVQSTSNGGLHANLRNNAGTEVGTSTDPVRIDPTGTTSQPIVGNIAAGATDSGNPIKTGGIYTTTVPLLISGQRGDHQVDENSTLSIVQNQATYTTMQKVYSATNISTLTVGTSETSIFLLKNPNASGIKLKLIRMHLTGAATYRLYHTPTITANGTALTAVNQRIMTSPTAAVATPFQSPTISANGTFIFPITASAQSGTIQVDLKHQPILNSNFNLLVTAQAGANNTSVNVTLFWAEVP